MSKGGPCATHLSAAITQARIDGLFSVQRTQEIVLLRKQDQSIRAIARELGRTPATISRALRHNAATRSRGLAYRASTAQRHTKRAARRPRSCPNDAPQRYIKGASRVLSRHRMGLTYPVHSKMDGSTSGGRRRHRRGASVWSPEQITRHLPLDYPGGQSHASQSLCVQRPQRAVSRADHQAGEHGRRTSRRSTLRAAHHKYTKRAYVPWVRTVFLPSTPTRYPRLPNIVPDSLKITCTPAPTMCS